MNDDLWTEFKRVSDEYRRRNGLPPILAPVRGGAGSLPTSSFLDDHQSRFMKHYDDSHNFGRDD